MSSSSLVIRTDVRDPEMFHHGLDVLGRYTFDVGLGDDKNERAPDCANTVQRQLFGRVFRETQAFKADISPKRAFKSLSGYPFRVAVRCSERS